MKRITSLFLAICLCVGLCIPTLAADADKFSFELGGNILYDQEDNNDMKAAQEIKTCQTIRGNFEWGPLTRDLHEIANVECNDYKDMDYYKFTLTEPSDVLVIATPAGKDKATEEFVLAVISDKNDKTLVRGTYTYEEGDSYNDNIILTTLDAGVYYLCILCKENNSRYDGASYECYFETIPATGKIKSSSTAQTSDKTTGALENFTKINKYADGQFQDVLAKDWFCENVKTAYELGLVKGVSETKFNPSGTVTLAETVTLAARINSIYKTGKADFAEAAVWYQTYVDYAIENSIIKAGEYSDYSKAATRAQFALILKNALPEEALAKINNVVSGKVPDVAAAAPYANAVYALYNAGILTGNDAYGTFTPDSTITRDAVAAIVTRMADKSLRKTFTLADKPVVASRVLLNATTCSCVAGTTFFLTATIEPGNATDKTIMWSSSNSAVAKVDLNGAITALKKGTATITATTTNGKSATCVLTVRDGTETLKKEDLTIKLQVYQAGRLNASCDVRVINNSSQQLICPSTMTVNGYVTHLSDWNDFVVLPGGTAVRCYWDGMNRVEHYKDTMYLDMNSIAEMTLIWNGVAYRCEFGTKGIIDLYKLNG